MRYVICIDPTGKPLTKGQKYQVLESSMRGDELMYKVRNDWGNINRYWASRFKEVDEFTDTKYYTVIIKIQEIKQRREKLGYKY